ncbi:MULTISPECIES: hypothetical protein [Moorena]|uniref:hypothetical protein n=1 Tax=Moorena TaxID=1155738 RepID=UPI0010566B3F|nr:MULTISPECIES: hypothetical protein [Moorena]NER89005.1 hypothetical protein [Moorena sp. SIO3A2]NES45076.1 hypothetical protein [Moorena sp. SIO2C4]NET67039.1 hypothetical protein [Moorena sp. SIO1G6]
MSWVNGNRESGIGSRESGRKKIPIKVGWAKSYTLEYSKKSNCFCPPYKLDIGYQTRFGIIGESKGLPFLQSPMINY